VGAAAATQRGACEERERGQVISEKSTPPRRFVSVFPVPVGRGRRWRSAIEGGAGGWWWTAVREAAAADGNRREKCSSIFITSGSWVMFLNLLTSIACKSMGSCFEFCTTRKAALAQSIYRFATFLVGFYKK
jgi:hypothetical protein